VGGVIWLRLAAHAAPYARCLQGTSDAPDAAYFAALEIDGPFNNKKVGLLRQLGSTFGLFS
jgi:hypothetical protein